MSENIQMTKGPIAKSLIAFSIPVLFSSLLSQLYVIVDSLVVSNFVGDEALASITNCINVAWFVTSFVFGCGMGVSVVISQAYGAKKYEWMRVAERTGLASFAIAGLAMALLGFVLADPLLNILQTPQEIHAMSWNYLVIYMAGFFFMALFYGISDVFNAIGDSRTPFLINLTSTVSNIILDLLFVAVFHWGVPGAAWATFLAQALGAGAALYLMRRLPKEAQFELRSVRIDTQALKQILKMGIPGGLENSAVSLANTVVQGSINTFGTAAMSAIGAASTIEGFAFLPMTAFSQALGTFSGQNTGAGNEKRTRQGTRIGLLLMSALSFGIGVVLFFGAGWSIRLFTRTEEVMALGIRRMKLVSLFYPLCGLTHCLSAVFRGAGKPMISMSAYIGCWCVLRMALLLIVLPVWHSYDFLCLVYPITWAASSLLLGGFYKFYPWFDKKQNPQSKPEAELEVLQEEA